jgi:transposase-like protein
MTENNLKGEVLRGPERRRRWAAAEKIAIVAETHEPGVTVSLVARRHGVGPNQVFSWRRLAAQGALTAAGAQEEVVPASAYRALQNQLRDAQRLLGKKTMEAEILKEALDIAGGQKNICCARSLRPRTVPDEGGLRSPRRFPVQHRGLLPSSSRQAS